MFIINLWRWCSYGGKCWCFVIQLRGRLDLVYCLLCSKTIPLDLANLKNNPGRGQATATITGFRAVRDITGLQLQLQSRGQITPNVHTREPTEVAIALLGRQASVKLGYKQQ